METSGIPPKLNYRSVKSYTFLITVLVISYQVTFCSVATFADKNEIFSQKTKNGAQRTLESNKKHINEVNDTQEEVLFDVFNVPILRKVPKARIQKDKVGEKEGIQGESTLTLKGKDIESV